MRWQGGRESDNVEDRRGMPSGPVMLGGGLGTVVIVLIALYLGVDPQQLLGPGGIGGAPGPGEVQAQADAPDDASDELKKFVRVILADTEDVWTEQFRQMHKDYRDPHLVLFRQQVDSACGMASTAVGPFYCPADEQVYLDLAFFQQLKSQFHAPGEFAQAYVIAHEVGHHVQKLLGIFDKVDAMRARMNPTEFNRVSVRLELQADFLAGVWAHHAQQARHILEDGDIEAGLNAASAIGDDRLQRETRGSVVPDSFTHGTSAQRVRWFKRGLESGNISDGDTFGAEEL